MAARRLVVVMLVLLFVSSLAAALAPVRPGENTTTSSSTTTTTTTRTGGGSPDGGGLVRAKLDAAAERPGTVTAAVGDQLQLRVVGRRPETVSIPRLGATENVGPLAPALFDFLLSEPGSYAVRVLETGRPIGTIEVNREARPGRARDRAAGRRAGRER